MKDIILTGPKHSGKTSAGKALASLCSCDFIDIDELITQRTGKTPRQLFNEGQGIFQKAEASALAAIVGAGGVEGGDKLRVIAAGGGIIDNGEALSILKKSSAVTVYLDIPAGSAWYRISTKGELPPFLKTKNPRETHRALHERRAAAYHQIANIVIDAKRKTPKKIAAEIYSHFS